MQQSSKSWLWCRILNRPAATPPGQFKNFLRDAVADDEYGEQNVPRADDHVLGTLCVKLFRAIHRWRSDLIKDSSVNETRFYL